MRRRLITLSAATSVLIAIAFVIPLAVVVRQLAHDRAVTGAENSALVLALSLTASDAEDIAATAKSIVASTWLTASVLLADGTVIGEPLEVGEDADPALAGTAGRNILEGGEAVYAPAIGPSGVSVVRVFVPNEELESGVRRAWMILAALGLGLVVLAIAIADAMGRSLRIPINDLAKAAERLGGGDLSTTVEPSGPAEITTVGHQFNRMASEVRSLLELERETAADLSHRLRTPMMAMRLGIDTLQSAAEREKLLDDLSGLERAIDVLIHQHRTRSGLGRDRATDLFAVLRDRVEFWEALADEQGRSSEFRTSPHADLIGKMEVAIGEMDLTAAIDALLGNIFVHTPEGVSYEVSLDVDVDRTATVIIEDGGPGVDGRAAQRGVSGGSSTGLGLDIARRAAEAAGGSLALSTGALGGTRIVMRLRPADGHGPPAA